MGKEENIGIHFKCRAEYGWILHFKLGRKHRYFIELAQGVKKKSRTLPSHRQYRKKSI
jgi:hypothetical protein